jgi:hypothetical protein
MIAALRKRCARLIPAEWRLRRPHEESAETIVAAFGSVEIRRIPGGCFASTSVIGEPAQARETALKRLTAYLNGNNRGAVRLHAERPIVQQQVGQRRWRINVRLSLAGNEFAPPAPNAPKVKVLFQEPQLLAVRRMAGRPEFGKISGGDVLDAIAGTEWIATATPMVRWHAFGPTGWFIGGFEVAVPVHRHGSHGELCDERCRSQLTPAAAPA